MRDSDQVASAFKIQAAFRERQARRAAAVARASIPSKHCPAGTRPTATFEQLPRNHRVDAPGLACADANTWTAEALEALDEDAAVELCEMQGLPWASMADFEEVQTALKCHFGVAVDVPMPAATSESIESYQSVHTDLKVHEPVAVQTGSPLGIDTRLDRVAELQGLRVRELEKIAQDCELEQWEIDEALDSDLPKQALMALIIMTQDESGTDVSSATRLPSLHYVCDNQTELDATVPVPQQVEKSTAVEAECKNDSQPPSDPVVDASARSMAVMESTDLAQAAAAAASDRMMEPAGKRLPTMNNASSRPSGLSSPIATPFAVPRAERAIDWLSEHVYPQLRNSLTALNDARCNSVSTAIQDPLGFLADALQRLPEVPAPVVLGRQSVASTSMLSYCATVRPALLDALIAANTER